MTNPTRKTKAISEQQTTTDRGHALENDSDLELVKRVQAGDVNSFGDLIDRHQRAVYGIVSRMVNNRDDADDLVQEIFVAVYRSIRTFRGEAKFSTWLHTIAVNMTLKRLRKMRHEPTLSIDDPDIGLGATVTAEDSTAPDDALHRREKQALVRSAIDSLPDKQKIVVIMHYFEHLSCEEIASVLKCSVGTVWSRLHYACKRLKAELDCLERG